MKFTFNKFKALYPDDNTCLDKLFQIRFTALKTCPHCSKDTKFHRVAKRMCYECQHCGYQLYPLAGTPFEKTRTNLTKWFHAIYLMTSTRNGVAAKEIERHLGVTYKCAWRMMHQIRKLMDDNGEIQLSGCVQADESYFGGYKRGGGSGRGSNNKTAVFGVVESNGKVKAQKVENVKRATLFPLIEKHVVKGSNITTDELNSYRLLPALGYTHQTVQHRLNQYVNENGKTTNTIEGWWSILKRSISSTHVWVSPKYLDRYIDEFEFRYNNRHSVVPMFEMIIQNVSRKEYKVDTETGEVTLFDAPKE